MPWRYFYFYFNDKKYIEFISDKSKVLFYVHLELRRYTHTYTADSRFTTPFRISVVTSGQCNCPTYTQLVDKSTSILDKIIKVFVVCGFNIKFWIFDGLTPFVQNYLDRFYERIVTGLEWLQRPSNISIQRGGDARFNCSVKDRGNNLVTWTKDGQTLFVNDNKFTSDGQYSITGEFNLVISNVDINNEALYTCSVQNLGAVRASLTVLIPPGSPSLSINDTRSSFVEGDVIVLICHTEGGNPAPTIKWSKNNELLPSTASINTLIPRGRSSSQLTITLDRSDHQAQYTCVVFNTLNQDRPLTITKGLQVQYSPNKPVIAVPQTYSVNESATAVVYCNVTANPEADEVKWERPEITMAAGNVLRINNIQRFPLPTYEWKKLDANRILSTTTSTLTIASASLSDNGNYSCTPKNTMGSGGTSMILVEVYEKPVLIDKPIPPTTTSREKVATSFGKTTELLCTAEAYPIPTFQWYKTTVPITAGGRYFIENTQIISVTKATSILRITNVRADDLGEYNCRAENINGRTTKTIMLVVTSRPEAPNNISMISKTWESVYLRWISGFDGGEKQSFYIHFISIPFNAHGAWNVSVIPPQELKFNVTRLMPYTTYEFRVYAENILGAGDKSEPITIRTNALEFPTISYVPKYKVEDRSLHLSVNVNDSYCVRIKVSKDGGRNWKTVVIENADCFDVKSQMLTIPEDGVDKLNISLCLLERQDVCGSHMSAQIGKATNHSRPYRGTIVVICRRRKLAKDYGNPSQANHRPQNVNGIPAANAKRGFDNQDMRGNPYYDSKTEEISFNGTPRKDPQQYIDLSHDDHKGDLGPESGYSTAETSKPKKVIYEVVV
ncbi:hypothetical protein KUTeg_006300 [Tegillarca granosa]|uniref:Uncharacterized protein n=1 Tax=Tegillarca granosa TaxID=220873 RepID=A0ABQ9FJD5_TEGGR|nr:hypothetical protein KUTeg_006300 [Tegillarca granosa]